MVNSGPKRPIQENKPPNPRGTLTNIYPFIIYILVTTFTPGPNNIMAMSNAMRFGFQKTLRFMAGVFIGFLVVLTLSGLLNAALAAQLPSLTKWFNILGAVYMTYLALHILRSKPDESDPNMDGSSSFKVGFSMQFLNVKGIMYGITVFSLFIIGTYHDPAAIFLFSLFFAGIGFLSTLSWAFGGNLFRSFLRRNYRVFNGVMAGLLIYTAIASLLK